MDSYVVSRWATANPVAIARVLSCLMSLLCQTAPLASLCSFTAVCFCLSSAVMVLVGSACWYLFFLTLQCSLLVLARLNIKYFRSHKHVGCYVLVTLLFTFCSHHVIKSNQNQYCTNLCMYVVIPFNSQTGQEKCTIILSTIFLALQLSCS